MKNIFTKDNKKGLFIILSFIIIFFSSIILAIFTFSGKINGVVANEIDEIPASTIPSSTPYIPETIDFVGESVPLDVYWVRENLDRELIVAMYQHSLTILSLKRSTRFFPIIEKILAENEIPDDFKYLCVAESNLQNVISPAKATGYWQFMETTGRKYGLEINDEVDERFHLEKSTSAACKYIRDLKNRFGSWTLAAAAFNMGETGLSKNITNQQNSNYWELFLNSETSRYIYRIIAYKLVFEKPYQYQFSLNQIDFYYPIPYKEFSVSSPIPDLYQFAIDQNITYRELKELNPWLRSTKLLKVKDNAYTIKIPAVPKSSSTFLFENKNRE